MELHEIFITDEQVKDLENWLLRLDKLSVKYAMKSEEAEKAGDEDIAKHYLQKSRKMDDKYMAILQTLDVFGICWKCGHLNDDGTEPIKLILP